MQRHQEKVSTYDFTIDKLRQQIVAKQRLLDSAAVSGFSEGG